MRRQNNVVTKIQRMSPSQASLLSHYRLVRPYMYNCTMYNCTYKVAFGGHLHSTFEVPMLPLQYRHQSIFISDLWVYQYGYIPISIGINRSNLSKYSTQPDTTVYLSIGNEYGLRDRYN
jgi:hypothetical protein